MPKYLVTTYESVKRTIEVEADNDREAANTGFSLIMAGSGYSESLGMEEVIEIEEID